MAKWASRFALGLSPSILGFTLEEKNINIIEDRCEFPKPGPEPELWRLIKIIR
jgi:hypothetical protein